MNAFHSVSALATPDNVKSIYWRLSSNFKPRGLSMEFHVDVADSSLADWLEITTAPIVDACVYIDKEKRRYNMVSDIWYRVRLILKDPAGVIPDKTLESTPAQLNGSLTDKAWLLGRAVIMSFYKNMKKGGGQQGFFLKRRIWGDRCPECVDFDVENVVNGHCRVCYGTGIVGGYHPGIPFWVMPSTVQGRSRKVGSSGVADDYGLSAECAAYPWIDSYDIWVDAKSNERFLIKTVSHVLEFERKPVVLALSMVKIANTDIALDIPVAAAGETFENINEVSGEVSDIVDKFPVTSDEVVSSKDTSDLGWRAGLKSEDW